MIKKCQEIIFVKYIAINVMLHRLLVGKVMNFDYDPENVKNDTEVQGVALGKTNLC